MHSLRVEFIYRSEHLCDPETGVFLVGDTEAGEEVAKVATWDVCHDKVDAFCVWYGV